MAKSDYLIILDDSDPEILTVVYSVKGSAQIRTKDFLRADTGSALRFFSKKVADFVGGGGKAIMSNDKSNPELDRSWKCWVDALLNRVSRSKRPRIELCE